MSAELFLQIGIPAIAISGFAWHYAKVHNTQYDTIAPDSCLQINATGDSQILLDQSIVGSVKHQLGEVRFTFDFKNASFVIDPLNMDGSKTLKDTTGKILAKHTLGRPWRFKLYRINNMTINDYTRDITFQLKSISRSYDYSILRNGQHIATVHHEPVIRRVQLARCRRIRYEHPVTNMDIILFIFASLVIRSSTSSI